MARLRDLGRLGLTLHAIALLGLGLRIAVQHGRSFEGDELGTLIFLERGYGFLLTHFEATLTMNWYVVLVKGLRDVLGASSWVLVAPSLAAGVATIYLAHALARRLLGERSAIAAALLVACCPTFVENSVVLRSYALFNALVLAAFLSALAWLDSRELRSGASCAAFSALALMMHANALYPLCFVGLWVLMDLRNDRRGWPSLVAPSALAALVVLAAYAPLWSGMQQYRAEWTVPPPAPWDYLPELVRRYLGYGWRGVPALALAGLGLWSAIRERDRTARLGLGILVPLCVTSLMGVATIRGAYARFLSPVLVILLFLVVHGADVLGRRLRWARPAALAVVLAAWIPLLVTLLETRDEKRYQELVELLVRCEPSIVFPIGKVDRFLSAEKQRDPEGSLAAWTARASASPDPPLIAVCSSGRLETRARAYALGDIQAVVYDEPRRGARIRHLYDDLLATLDGFPIDARFLDHYGALMTLAAQAGDQAKLLRYTVYYYECFLRSKRFQDVPDRQLATHTTVTSQELIRNALLEATPESPLPAGSPDEEDER